MTKRLLVTICTAIVLCLCCLVSFADENNNSITLGNEVMQSIDKTQSNFDNLVSGNMVTDAANSVVNGALEVKDGMEKDMTKTNQNYNVTQTTTEGSIGTNGMNTMTTTTWMWIILAVAAIIIITAIWYYATQNNN